MTRDTTDSERRLTRRQQAIVSLVAVVCILLAGATVAVAQQGTFSDDFEDGDVDGWEGDDVSVDTFSTEGTYSIRQPSGFSDFADRAEWDAGPTLDMSEEFTIEGTMYMSQTSFRPFRVGLINENDEGAMLVFNPGDSQTFLASSGQEDPPDTTIQTSFGSTWINYEIVGEGGNMTAKVWEVGSSEPSSFQLQRDFNTSIVSPFAANPGAVDDGREMWLDSVQVEGTSVPDDDEGIRLDVPGYLQHNASSSYAVEANQSGNWVDVTGEAEVTPDNTDALTFYPDNQTVVAGGNKSINERVNITAGYGGLNATDYTVVATPTVDNLDLLPAWWSVNAVLSDWTMIWILLSTLIATAASRMSTTFAGIGAFVMAMIMGWIMGDVPDGIMVATIFMGLFIGLNLAANIDYSVR